MFLTFLCISVNAQERFNNVYYDPDANISNTVVAVDNGFVVLTGTSVNDGRGIGLTKISAFGEMEFQKSYKLEDFDCYEGFANCFKFDTFQNSFYMCGTSLDFDNNPQPFIITLDENLDTISFSLINIDSIYGAYDIIKFNDWKEMCIHKYYVPTTKSDFNCTDIVQIYNQLPSEYTKYLFVCNMLCSRTHCHLILNNKEFLQISRPLFEKYKLVFKYLIGYAWITLKNEDGLEAPPDTCVCVQCM